MDPAAARAVRNKLPTLLHRLCEALCARADEGKAVRAMKQLREHGVTPDTATCVAIAQACGRRNAGAALSELSSLLLTLRRAIGNTAYSEAARACVSAGAPSETLLGEEAADGTDAAAAGDDSAGAATAGAASSSGGAAAAPSGRGLGMGASDAKAERAALAAVQTSALLREREEVTARRRTKTKWR